MVTLFGPYNLNEARAISISDPVDCTYWKSRTHLEDAGVGALHLAGIKKAGCRSHHFGGEISTITYRGAKIVQCNIDNAEGAYICSDKLAPVFSKGLDLLIEEKLNPESEINKRLSEGRKMVEEGLKSAIMDADELSKIKQSAIFELIDEPALRGMKKKCIPKYVSETELIDFIEGFYHPNLAGRNVNIGMVLYYFSLPVGHLIEPAIKEQIDIFRTYNSLDDPKVWENCLRQNPEELLFGEE
ncbi:Uncharacterised protein [uncultured archaeon]|nr:Uncharacterised protein [uncultured archaeon]